MVNDFNMEELRAADFVDSANAAVELEVLSNIALAKIRAASDLKSSSLRPDGECHYCGRSVEVGLLFCDDECNAEYVAEQEQNSRLNKMKANIDVSRFS